MQDALNYDTIRRRIREANRAVRECRGAKKRRMIARAPEEIVMHQFRWELFASLQLIVVSGALFTFF